jgi:hypothetical protein
LFRQPAAQEAVNRFEEIGEQEGKDQDRPEWPEDTAEEDEKDNGKISDERWAGLVRLVYREGVHLLERYAGTAWEQMN